MMARAKKDGVYINLRIERELREKLDAYADEKGQSLTVALERILKQFFEEQEKNCEFR